MRKLGLRVVGRSLRRPLPRGGRLPRPLPAGEAQYLALRHPSEGHLAVHLHLDGLSGGRDRRRQQQREGGEVVGRQVEDTRLLRALDAGDDEATVDPIDAQPVGLAVARREGRVDDPLREGVAADPFHPAEERGVAVGEVPREVGDAWQLEVVGALAGEAGLLEGLHHLPRGRDVHGVVLVSVKDEDLLVRGVLDDPGVAGEAHELLVERAPAGGPGHEVHVRDSADRRDRGEPVGVTQADVPGAAPAHREAGEMHAVGVHAVGPLHVVHGPQHVALGDAVVAGRLAPAVGREHDEPDVGVRDVGADGLVVLLARSVAEAEDPAPVEQVIRAGAVQAHHQGPRLRRVVGGRDVEAVGLERAVDLGPVGLGEGAGAALPRVLPGRQPLGVRARLLQLPLDVLPVARRLAEVGPAHLGVLDEHLGRGQADVAHEGVRRRGLLARAGEGRLRCLEKPRVLGRDEHDVAARGERLAVLAGESGGEQVLALGDTGHAPGQRPLDAGRRGADRGFAEVVELHAREVVQGQHDPRAHRRGERRAVRHAEGERHRLAGIERAPPAEERLRLVRRGDGLVVAERVDRGRDDLGALGERRGVERLRLVGGGRGGRQRERGQQGGDESVAHPHGAPPSGS